jgi:hypothetical protein
MSANESEQDAPFSNGLEILALSKGKFKTSAKRSGKVHMLALYHNTGI